MKMCPYCTKEVQEDAVKCKHCGGWFANNADAEQKKMDDQKRVEKMIQGKEDKAAADDSPDQIGAKGQIFIRCTFKRSGKNNAGKENRKVQYNAGQNRFLPIRKSIKRAQRNQINHQQ